VEGRLSLLAESVNQIRMVSRKFFESLRRQGAYSGRGRICQRSRGELAPCSKVV